MRLTVRSALFMKINALEDLIDTAPYSPKNTVIVVNCFIKNSLLTSPKRKFNRVSAISTF